MLLNFMRLKNNQNVYVRKFFFEQINECSFNKQK